jgi:multiple sugar transport system substrate-binding protein
MRRFTASLLACATAAVLALSGCGRSDGPETQLWVRSAAQALAEHLVTEFNRAHPDRPPVKLTVVPTNDMLTKFAAAYRGGEPPDLIGLDVADMARAITGRTLSDLTDDVRKLPYAGALAAGHMQAATHRGKIYGVPFNEGPSVLYYNKTLLAKAGVDPDRPPASQAEILAAARAVRGADARSYGFSFPGACGGCLFFTMLPMIWASGGDVLSGPADKPTVTIDSSPQVRQVLDLYRQLWSEGLVPPAQRTENGATWGQEFLAGTVAMTANGLPLAAQLTARKVPFEWGVAPLPGATGGYSTFDGGDDFAIPQGARHKSGAWAFIRWVHEAERQRDQQRFGYPPVRSDVATPEYVKQYPIMATALTALRNGRVVSSTKTSQLFTEPNGPWLSLVQTAVYSGRVDAALAKAQRDFRSTVEQGG